MNSEVIDIGNQTTTYCVFWGSWQIQRWWSCMTKSEWSSWIQAIGSVVAILSAIYIANRQFIKSERVKEESAARILMQIFGQINLFYESHWPEYKSHENKLSENFYHSINNMHQVMDERLTILRSIPIENLSAQWAICCVMSRSTYIQLMVEIDRLRSEIVNYEMKKRN